MCVCFFSWDNSFLPREKLVWSIALQGEIQVFASEREQSLRGELIVLWEELSTAVVVDKPEGKKGATHLTPTETTRTKGKKLQT